MIVNGFVAKAFALLMTKHSSFLITHLAMRFNIIPSVSLLALYERTRMGMMSKSMRATSFMSMAVL